MSDSCLASAMRSLAIRSHFSKELSDKLKLKGFSEPECSEAIEKLTRLGLLNDPARAEDFIQYQLGRGYGPRWILFQLIQKSGMPRGELESLCENGITDELQRTVLERLLYKKGGAKSRNPKEVLKLKTYFFRRGFDQHIILSLLKGGLEECDSSWE